MENTIYLRLVNLVVQFNCRIMTGPPLQEHEFCVYKASCEVIEAMAINLKSYIDKDNQKVRKELE